MNLIPAIGAKGIYSLDNPFNALLTINVPYTCRAIRKLEDISGAGEDPFELYYNPYKLDVIRFDKDVSEGVCIISLQSDTGDWVYVPSSCIQSYPSISGVIYRAMMIGVSLGTQPDTLDLATLEDEIVHLVKRLTGINAVTKQVQVSKEQLISHDIYDTMEVVRKSRITSSDSTLLQNIELKQQVSLLQEQLTALQNYIRTKLN